MLRFCGRGKASAVVNGVVTVMMNTIVHTIIYGIINVIVVITSQNIVIIAF
jgi:hypothetical protein